MRDATLKEQQSIQEHIDEISEPTGVDFYELLELEKQFVSNSACERCPNNPNNGGTGICFCTLASPVIY